MHGSILQVDTVLKIDGPLDEFWAKAGVVDYRVNDNSVARFKSLIKGTYGPKPGAGLRFDSIRGAVSMAGLNIFSENLMTAWNDLIEQADRERTTPLVTINMRQMRRRSWWSPPKYGQESSR